MSRRQLYTKTGESPVVVYEVVRELGNGDRVLLFSSSGTWTVSLVPAATFTNDYVAYSPTITAGDNWTDDTGAVVTVDGRFVINSTAWAVFHPVDTLMPQLLPAADFRTKYTKVV